MATTKIAKPKVERLAFSFYATPEMHEQIIKRTEESHRSRSAEVIWLIEKGLEATAKKR
jgi:hypothetical protein